MNKKLSPAEQKMLDTATRREILDCMAEMRRNGTYRSEPGRYWRLRAKLPAVVACVLAVLTLTAHGGSPPPGMRFDSSTATYVPGTSGGVWKMGGGGSWAARAAYNKLQADAAAAAKQALEQEQAARRAAEIAQHDAEAARQQAQADLPGLQAAGAAWTKAHSRGQAVGMDAKGHIIYALPAPSETPPAHQAPPSASAEQRQGVFEKPIKGPQGWMKK
jgi:hypothetical protein